ncbi:MAG: hypothetical protein M9899_08320 [Bdellovibrionaceae bacterium]|nr:hypothetical protein [Pseudobdellovibrionaceae bacterium]
MKKNEKPVDPLADIVYWNGYTESSITYPTQYTEDMFIQNYETLKSQFLDPLPVPLKASSIEVKGKNGVQKTFVSEYPEFPEPIASVYNMKVNGTVPNGYTTLPNKNVDIGALSNGVDVIPDTNYAPFIFGDLPILHVAKSKETIEIIFERCLIGAGIDPPSIEMCKFQYLIALEAWNVLFNYFYEIGSIHIRYTLKGTYSSQEHQVVHDFVYNNKTFVDVNGNLDVASSKYMYSPEGTDINDGWLFGKTPYIYVPDYFTSPTVTLEMFTQIPDDIFDDLDTLNLKAYIAAGLVEDERELPKVINVEPFNESIAGKVKDASMVRNSKAHGRLMMMNRFVPVSLESQEAGFYYGKSHAFEVQLHTSDLKDYEVTGVMVSIKRGDEHYPNVITYPKGGKIYTGSSVTMNVDGNPNIISIVVNPYDIFEDSLILEMEEDNALDLRFQLVLDDTTTPGVEELISPVFTIVTLEPIYDLMNEDIMDYAPIVPPWSFNEPSIYSTPRGSYAKNSLAKAIRKLTETLVFNPLTDQLLRINDGTLPYGGGFDVHGGHQRGVELDIRYPHPQSQDWDQSKNRSEASTSFCSSTRGRIKFGDGVRIHGYKKYLSIKNYLWIKRLTKDIHENYKYMYGDANMKLLDTATEDHRGDLVDYIANTFCPSEAPIPKPPTPTSLQGLCYDLFDVYTSGNLVDIDNLVTYIRETRSNIELMDEETDYKLTLILSSDGRDLTDCFPTEQSTIGFEYSTDWHKLLMQEGVFPDGVQATESSVPLGEWLDAPKTFEYNENDQSHLSHLHIEASVL